MSDLSDLYDATRAYELEHGLADEPRLSTPIPEEWQAERLAANAKLKAEWEKEKFAVQFFGTASEAWIDCEGAPTWRDECEYRRKPAPVYVPWTAEDAKEFRGIWVRHKQGNKFCTWLIDGTHEAGVRFGNTAYTFLALLGMFEQILPDGTARPCGKVKEEGK